MRLQLRAAEIAVARSAARRDRIRRAQIGNGEALPNEEVGIDAAIWTHVWNWRSDLDSCQSLRSRDKRYIFYAELLKAANSCQFKNTKDRRDKVLTMFIMGELFSVETRKRLLEKEALTSKKACEQTEAKERVGVNTPHLKKGPQDVGVAQMKLKSHIRQRAGLTPDRKVGSKQGTSTGENETLGVRGADHVGYECFMKAKAYRKVCKIKGYIPASCIRINRRNAKDSQCQIHWCEEPAGSSNSEDEIAQQRVNVVEITSRAHLIQQN